MEITEWIEQRRFMQESIKYGIELERNVPVDSEAIRRKFHIDHNHNGNFVAQRWHYTGDPSVITGHELKLAGDNYTFRKLHRILADAEERLDELEGVAICPSTSNHITFVCPSKLLDGNILRNAMQITKSYAAALHYITSGTLRHISRPESYGHYARAHLGVSVNPMLGDLFITTGKYSMCNISKTQLKDRSTPILLRVEFRHPDGIRIPSALAAIVFLHKAILLKAVDESINGIASCQKIRGTDGWEQNQMLYNALERNMGANIAPEVKEACRREANDLLDYLEPVIKAEQDSDSIMFVLRKLAEKNVSDRYGAAATREKNASIEKDLMPAQHREAKLTELQTSIIKVVLLEKVQADSITAAKAALATRFGCNDRTIRYAMMGLETMLRGKIGFDKATGRFIIGKEG